MERQHDATKTEMLETIASLRADAKAELFDTKVVWNPNPQILNPKSSI